MQKVIGSTCDCSGIQSFGYRCIDKGKAKNKSNQYRFCFPEIRTHLEGTCFGRNYPSERHGQVANVKIKIEADREPPLGFETEDKLLLKPFSFYVKCLTLPNLFAGKMHALLFRKWGET